MTYKTSLQLIRRFSDGAGAIFSMWSLIGLQLISHWCHVGPTLISHSSHIGANFHLTLISHQSDIGLRSVPNQSQIGHILISSWFHIEVISGICLALVSHWSHIDCTLISHWSRIDMHHIMHCNMNHYTHIATYACCKGPTRLNGTFHSLHYA